MYQRAKLGRPQDSSAEPTISVRCRCAAAAATPIALVYASLKIDHLQRIWHARPRIWAKDLGAGEGARQGRTAG